MYIPDDSVVHETHDLRLLDKKQKADPKKGYEVQMTRVFDIQLPNGSQVVVTTAPIMAGLSGQVSTGRLGYGALDIRAMNNDKYDSSAKIQTIGNTEAYGIPSGINASMQDAVEQVENNLNPVVADSFDRLLKNIGRNLQVDSFEADLMIVRDVDGNKLSQVANVQELSAKAHMYKQIKDICEKDVTDYKAGRISAEDMEEAEFTNIVTYINDDGRYETEKTSASKFDYSSPTYKDKTVVGYMNYAEALEGYSKMSQLNSAQVGKYESIEKHPFMTEIQHTERVKEQAYKLNKDFPVGYDPISVFTPEVEFEKIRAASAELRAGAKNPEPFDSYHQYRDINGVVGNADGLRSNAVYGRNKPQLEGVKVRDLNFGNDVNAIGKQFHRYSLNAQPITTSGTSVEEYKQSVLQEVGRSLEDVKDEPVLIALDSQVLNECAGLDNDIKRMIINAKKQDLELRAGLVVTSNETTALFDSQDLVGKQELLDTVYKQSNRVLSNEAVSELRAESENKVAPEEPKITTPRRGFGR